MALGLPPSIKEITGPVTNVMARPGAWGHFRVPRFGRKRMPGRPSSARPTALERMIVRSDLRLSLFHFRLGLAACGSGIALSAVLMAGGCRPSGGAAATAESTERVYELH